MVDLRMSDITPRIESGTRLVNANGTEADGRAELAAEQLDAGVSRGCVD